MTQTRALSFQDTIQTTSSIRTEWFSPPWESWGEQKIEKTLPWKQTLLTTFLSAGVLVGTGGIANANIIPLPYDSPTCLVWFTHQTSHRPSQLIDTGERLAALRRYFSLNITDLAKVLRVERPTIYSWLQGNSAPHPGNLKRLEKIYQLSRDWRTLSATPVGKYVHQPFEDGCSLLDYLSAEEPNEMAIRYAFNSIKSQHAQDKRISTARRRSVAEVAKLHGFPSVPEHIQKENFDEETNL